MRVLFYYRGIESLGIGYLMSMLSHAGHHVDLIFKTKILNNYDDNDYDDFNNVWWYCQTERRFRLI